MRRKRTAALGSCLLLMACGRDPMTTASVDAMSSGTPRSPLPTAAMPPELAEPAPACDFWSGDATSPLALARVRDDAGPRLRFRTGGPACPDGPACEERAYVVPGDRLVVQHAHASWPCVAYVGKTSFTAGYVPTSALLDVPVAEVDPQSWVGAWSTPAPVDATSGRSRWSAGLDITRSDDELAIEGSAFWSSEFFDPETGMGPIRDDGVEGALAVSGRFGRHDEDGEPECGLRLQHLGEFLVVDDLCPFQQATFEGIYRREDPTQ